jgi:hypothetical protein
MKVYGFVGQPNRSNTGLDALLLRALNGRLTETDLSLFFHELVSEDIKGLMLTRLLRFVVDKWIDSGRNGDEESPWKRRPWRGLIRDYFNQNPPELFFTKNGLSLLVGRPRNAHGDGRGLAWFAECVKEIRSQLPDGRPPDTKSLHSAADRATALYLQMLDSPITARLFRCDGCGAYFARTRAPKKGTPISRGSWCANCKREGNDRKRRTEESRRRRTNQMIEWGADAWLQWQPERRHRDGEREEWVAHKVNKRQRWRHITANWVTRHQTEIEAEVERRSHATRKN